MTTQLISVADALALYESIPSIISADGDSSVKRRAYTFENSRIGETNDFDVSFAQRDETTLPSGKVIKSPVAPLQLKSAAIAGDTVIINGVEIPVVLAFAIINAAYIKYQPSEV